MARTNREVSRAVCGLVYARYVFRYLRPCKDSVLIDLAVCLPCLAYTRCFERCNRCRATCDKGKGVSDYHTEDTSAHSRSFQIFEGFEGRELGNIGRMIQEIVRWQIE